MASTSLVNKHNESLILADSVPTQFAQAVCNPDGSDINSSVSVSLTEFPAPAEASDDYANPNTTDVKSFNMLWDGATWDRAPGNSTDGILVNLGTNNDVTVTGSGTFAVQNTEARTASSTVSSVASSATNVTLLASNAARRMATIYNDSTQILYLKVGSATASSTSYTTQLSPNAYYEVPFPVCTGIIDGIWASANGSARITEW